MTATMYVFFIRHREFIFRIIQAYYDRIVFTGESEEQAIADLLAEFEKEVA